jgi:hypothetical protein
MLKTSFKTQPTTTQIITETTDSNNNDIIHMDISVHTYEYKYFFVSYV